MATVNKTIRVFACLRSTATCPTPARRCPRCLRPFSSNTAYRQGSKRQLMTESAYRPASLEPPPSAPRNAQVPNTSIAGGTSQGDSVTSQLKWRGSSFIPENLKKEGVQVSEVEAQIPKPTTQAQPQSQPSPSPSTTPAARPARRTLRPRKAAMTLTSAAVERLHELLDDPDPKLIRVGVKNKGCSGSAYHLEYVDKPGKFDEQVEQDGVKVLIDSKALIKVIGSEMDFVEDKLSARFTFRNPNITEQCGCGESFSVV